MKNVKSFLAVAIFLSILSCKKNEAPDVLNTPETTTAVQQPVLQEDLVKEAQKSPLTTIALKDPNYNFGDIKKGDVVEHDFVITNTGENPLIISDVKPACGCTAPEFTKEPILPGKSGIVKLKFDSSNFEGMQNKSAEVYANTEKTPITLYFMANVLTK